MPNDQARIYASCCRGILLQAAIKAKGQFIGWSQHTIGYQLAYDAWLEKGRSQGFSIKFLHCCKNNVSFTDKVNTKELKTEGIHDRNELHNEILLASQAGNTKRKTNELERNNFMYKKYKLNLVETKEFHYGLFYELATLCGKQNSATLIFTKTHVMAFATYNELSQFFEPNAGIVILPPYKINCLLSAYFENTLIKCLYGQGQTIKFNASAYR